MSVEAARDPHAIKAMGPDEIVEHFRGFVGSIVNRLRSRLHIRVAVEDLDAYAVEGLLEAHARFDPEAGATFASFAYYRIRGAVLDGCRKEGWLTRDRRADAQREAAIDEYMETAGATHRGSPRPGSLSEAIDRVAEMVDDTAVIFLLEQETLDTIHSAKADQHRRLERKTNIGLVRAALEALSDEEREIIKRHHYEGERMEDIAEEFGHSKSWVSRINTRALEKMREHILQLE